ncbi:hypothetical protein Tco_0251029 [Tanacetum coccineum]
MNGPASSQTTTVLTSSTTPFITEGLAKIILFHEEEFTLPRLFLLSSIPNYNISLLACVPSEMEDVIYTIDVMRQQVWLVNFNQVLVEELPESSESHISRRWFMLRIEESMDDCVDTAKLRQIDTVPKDHYWLNEPFHHPSILTSIYLMLQSNRHKLIKVRLLIPLLSLLQL